MDRKEEIDAELLQLKMDFENAAGTKTEVYTRIVGYYRNVGNFNKGKVEEYKERVAYSPESLS